MGCSEAPGATHWVFIISLCTLVVQEGTFGACQIIRASGSTWLAAVANCCICQHYTWPRDARLVCRNLQSQFKPKLGQIRTTIAIIGHWRFGTHGNAWPNPNFRASWNGDCVISTVKELVRFIHKLLHHPQQSECDDIGWNEQCGGQHKPGTFASWSWRTFRMTALCGLMNPNKSKPNQSTSKRGSGLRHSTPLSEAVLALFCHLRFLFRRSFFAFNIFSASSAFFFFRLAKRVGLGSSPSAQCLLVFGCLRPKCWTSLALHRGEISRPRDSFCRMGFALHICGRGSRVCHFWRQASRQICS